MGTRSSCASQHSERTAGPIVSQPPPTPDFRIHRTESGFRVALSPATVAGGPCRARLQASYAVNRGDAFSKYREFDFRLHGENALTVNVAGGTWDPGDAGNELFLVIEDPHNFSVGVTGFDQLRDVRVRVVKERVTETDDSGG